MAVAHNTPGEWRAGEGTPVEEGVRQVRNYPVGKGWQVTESDCKGC